MDFDSLIFFRRPSRGWAEANAGSRASTSANRAERANKGFLLGFDERRGYGRRHPPAIGQKGGRLALEHLEDALELLADVAGGNRLRDRHGLVAARGGTQ